MVKIRMKRMGMKKEPFYRIVVIDSRNARAEAARLRDMVYELKES